MVVWLFLYIEIVTFYMASIIPSLATRADALKADNCFIGKLMNYDKDEYDNIVKAVNDKATEFQLVEMDTVAHLKFGPNNYFTLIGIKPTTQGDNLDLVDLNAGSQIPLIDYSTHDYKFPNSLRAVLKRCPVDGKNVTELITFVILHQKLTKRALSLTFTFFISCNSCFSIAEVFKFH